MRPDTRIEYANSLGLASVALGVIGLLLFLLPILGIPLGACGLLLGLAALCLPKIGDRSQMRWPVAGTAFSSLALLVGLAMALAPQIDAPSRSVPRMWQTAPGRPFVPPPRHA